MKIDFNVIKEMTIPGMNSGSGTMTASMYNDDFYRIIPTTIHPGGSIGIHKQETGDDLNYIISGNGKAICDGVEEELAPGIMHICPKDSEHSIVNTGTEDLVMLTIVVEKWLSLRKNEQGENMILENFVWTGEPAEYVIEGNILKVTTSPHTDLWQRTYYHFRNDNAPVFQMETEEKYFSFIVKTTFEESHHRFDQCGVVMYLDSDNWLKASIEYENDEFQHLGSVVTNHGYSDWATTEIPANVKSMWYRLSRREDDYCIECSEDGARWKQMRVCHMHEGAGKVRFGVYACSPENSSFTAVFSNIKLVECTWKAHDGQQPD